MSADTPDTDTRDTTTVWVGSASRRSARRVFHTKRGCRYVTETHKKRSITTVPESYTECTYCSGKGRRQNPDEWRQSLRSMLGPSGDVDPVGGGED